MPQDPKYAPTTANTAFANVVQNCGETLHALGKIGRWGVESYNPLTIRSQRETNRRLALRKFDELRAALDKAEEFLAAPDVGTLILNLAQLNRAVVRLHAAGGIRRVREVMALCGFQDDEAMLRSDPSSWRQFINIAMATDHDTAATKSEPPGAKKKPAHVRDFEDDGEDQI